jgi:hypothetical protein
MRHSTRLRRLTESRPRWIDPPKGPFGPVTIHASTAIDLVNARRAHDTAA